MHFTNPTLLWALIPVAVALYLLERRVPGTTARRRWRFGLRLLVCAAALAALAGPHTRGDAPRPRRIATLVDASADLGPSDLMTAREEAATARAAAAEIGAEGTGLEIGAGREHADLGSALARAELAFDDSELGSILVFTAGRGSIAGVPAALARLRARGIRVHALPFPRKSAAPAPGPTLEAIEAPLIARGPFVVRARAAPAGREVQLRLLVNGEPQAALPVSPTEATEVAFEALDLPPGEHELAVALELAGAEGAAARLDLMRRLVTVGAPPRVLALLVDPQRSVLRRALSAQGMQVVAVPPEDALEVLTGGQAAEVVVLDPASAIRLPAEAQQALLTRIQEGLGVLLEAGDSKPAWEALRASALAAALPLRPEIVPDPPKEEPKPTPPPPPDDTPPIDPPEDDEGPGIEAQRQPSKALPITLLLVVDRSASMIGPKLELAIEGARRAAASLSEWDRVGVITFADEPTLNVPPRSASQAAELPLWLSTVQAGGGTDIFRALRLASQVLAREKTPIQHVLLLTDGKTGGITLWPHVVGPMGRRGVTMTAVGIGPQHSRRQLRDIIQWAARSSLVSVYEPSELPTVLTKDTRGLASRRDAEAERLDRLHNPDQRPEPPTPDEPPEQPRPPPRPPDDPPPAPDTPAPTPAPTLEPLRIARPHEALTGFIEGALPRVAPPRAAQPVLGAQLLVLRRDQAVLAVRRYGLGRTAVWALGSQDPGTAAWADLGRLFGQTTRAVMAGEGAFRFLPRIVITETPDGDRVHVEWPRGDATRATLAWTGEDGQRVELGTIDPSDPEPVRDLPDPGPGRLCRVHIELEDGRPMSPVTYLSAARAAPVRAAGDADALAALFGPPPPDAATVGATLPSGRRPTRHSLALLFLWIAVGLLPLDVFAHRRGAA